MERGSVERERREGVGRGRERVVRREGERGPRGCRDGTERGGEKERGRKRERGGGREGGRERGAEERERGAGENILQPDLSKGQLTLLRSW